MSDYSPLSSFSGAKLPLRPMHVWGIRVRLQVARRTRDLALFDLVIASKLRGCDVVALRLTDISRLCSNDSIEFEPFILILL